MTRTAAIGRLLSLGALVATAVAIWIIANGTNSYTIHAQFVDASQLISGDLVEAGGQKIGTVSAIGLNAHGLADVALHITDAQYVPLHQGTFATIALPGLAAVANRYVAIVPGSPSAPEIRNGSTISLEHTRSAVDLDQLLDSFGPSTRADVKTLIREDSAVLAPPTSRQFNRGLAFLDPALSQIAQLGRQLVTDRASLRQLVTSTAAVSAALAQRQQDVSGSIRNTAATLKQVADRASQLGDALTRAPGVFIQMRGVLGDTDNALRALRPTLRDLRPAINPAATLLRRLQPVAEQAVPTVRALSALIPSARAALARVSSVAPQTARALDSLRAAIPPLIPVVSGLRVYMPDIVAGFFQGMTGAFGGGYDANGRYNRVQFLLGETSGSALPLIGGIAPPSNGTRTGLTARCPGGATQPAPDGSNPWVPPGFTALCDPADDYSK